MVHFSQPVSQPVKKVYSDSGYLRVSSYVKSSMKMFILRYQEKLILEEFMGWNLFVLGDGFRIGWSGMKIEKAKTKRISNLHP